MNELELKYGCNPNQKPSKVFMQDGSDLPFTVLNGKPGYINLLAARRRQLQARLPRRCRRGTAPERGGPEDLLRG